MPRAITAINGQKCCRRMPTACSRKTVCSTAILAAASETKSWVSAAAARHSNPLSLFVDAGRKSMRCCGIMAWQVLRIEAVCANVFLMHELVMKLRILICALLLSAGASQAGNLYRWVDSDGTVHYSDQQPPPSAKDVQQKKLG